MVHLHDEINPEDSVSIAATPSEVSVTRKATIVWQHFTKMDEKIVCNACKKVYSSASSTSTLKHHLELKHATIHNLIFPVVKREGSLDRFIHSNKIPFSEKQKKAIVYFVVDTYQSFNMIDNISFKEFIGTVDRRLQTPTRKTVKGWVKEYYEKGKIVLKEKLSTINSIALTTDIWTSGANHSYSSLMAHFINEEWQSNFILLDCSFIATPHTQNMIYDWLIFAIKEWEIEKRVVSITSDTASNGAAAIAQLSRDLKKSTGVDILHVRCVAHIINLVVQAGLEEISSVLAELRVMATILKNSPKQWEILQSFALVKLKKMKLDSPTRWGSTVDMLERFIDNKSSLKKWFAHAKADKTIKSMTDVSLDESTFETITAVSNLLNPFQLATVDISGSSYPTLSTTRVILGHLMNHVSTFTASEELDPDSRVAISRVKDAIVDKFKYVVGKWTINLDFASFLDPFMKDYAFQHDVSYFGENLFKSYDEVKQAFLDEFCLKFSTIDNPAPVNTVINKKRKSLMDTIKLNHLESSVLEPCQAVSIWLERKVEASPLEDSRAAVSAYWRSISRSDATLVCLEKMARFYLGIPATSVSSEQLFSKAGNLVVKRRSSLKPETVQMMLCVQNWFQNKLYL
jgi:hypothetical protein